MKILFDHQIFEMQKFGGISRYFFELLNHFDADTDIEWELPITYSDNEYLKSLPSFSNKLVPKSAPNLAYKKFLGGRSFKGKHLVYKFKQKFRADTEPSAEEAAANRQLVIDKLKKGDFDIFHPTYYNDYFLDHIGNKPFVLTVYDLIHQIFPELGMYEKVDKSKKLFDAAHTIVAISESTKSDLVSIFGIREEKVVVTHLANSMQVTNENVSADFSKKIPSKYLLYVGGRSGYKNFLFFVQIFASVLENYPDLNIVCTGAGFDHDEIFLLNKLKITDRVHHTYVNDKELNYLYRNAVALVFPSMYEGFGLPVLEAFSCGCPVLTSNSSSLSEIGEDAVLYFEPKSPHSMKKALLAILTDASLREQKIEQGYQQLKKFSWQITADQTKKIYEGIL